MTVKNTRHHELYGLARGGALVTRRWLEDHLLDHRSARGSRSDVRPVGLRCGAHRRRVLWNVYSDLKDSTLFTRQQCGDRRPVTRSEQP